MPTAPLLGIDIGSVSVSCALLDPAGGVLATECRAHRGRVREALSAAVGGLGAGAVAGIAATGAAPRLLSAARAVDPLVALVAAARRLDPQAASILVVGGERFSLVRLDAAGGYEGVRSNTSCAAGTGSFLDQQARRLGLAGSRELAAAAIANTGEPPRISTRCAVFARTDLVHAQQEGYSLEEICDGLCAGLARNVADTVLAGEPPRPPVLFAGGVAANEAVRRHLERAFGVPVRAHPLSAAMGAIGAALDLLAAGAARGATVDLSGGIEPLLAAARGERRTYYAPLPAARGDGRDADGTRRFVHGDGRFSRRHPVEVEVFREPPRGPVPAWLGIDVGSTSTKAVLVGEDGEPVLGLYARTLGQPVSAAQALLEAASAAAAASGASWRVDGAAATGAGRKFVGRILGADLVLDEISAHARAAVELVPDVDTIIEIGGQDAKFTTLRAGRVTFAHMNTVCAAGTGSFLEEQALRLGVDLAEYAGRVAGVRAPLASDRCAVFMERDINDLLSLGFSVDEILAASLFAVRENYLQKVARGAAMGSTICFQGATARNPALVAAFEQGLGKRVHVSRFCHLTGALGAALALRDDARRAAAAGEAAAARRTAFRGFDAALAGDVPIRAETCGLCANHCRLRIADVAGETVAYGFLCGRDYDTKRFVNANRSGFDLAAERRRAFAAEGMAPAPLAPLPGRRPTIGLPAALGMVADLPRWRRFFAELGVPVVTSEGFEEATALGRDVEGAEFCAPVSALHGHAAWLADRADWIFLPVRIDDLRPGEDRRRPFCYYTQFSPALVAALAPLRDRVLMPYGDWTVHRDRALREVAAALRTAGVEATERRVAEAFDRAEEGHRRAMGALRARFREEMAGARDPRVVLIGRPYTVLAPDMNKGIPAIFGTLGVKTFFQDMVPRAGREALADLLGAFHWHYAAEALETALEAARTPMLYPVYVTAFKCSPDSFALDAFRRIMDAHDKPYLVLQLDDHDSSMGYETRIEAAVRAFRNHAEETDRARPRAGRPLPVPPREGQRIGERTLLLANFDPVAGPLVAANLRREGVDARLLVEDETSIRAAMRHNTGQCIPLNAIVQAAAETIRLLDLDPARTLVWMSRSTLSCNIPLFPHQMQELFAGMGGGLEKVTVYVGDLSFVEISARAALNTARAYLFAGYLSRISCRLRPYETAPGATDRARAEALTILAGAFAAGARLGPALARAVACFDRVPAAPGRRPKVAIFGDLYVRDNDVFNQDLVRAIEEAGGEAVVTPPADYARIVVGELRARWRLEAMYQPLLVFGTLVGLLDRMDRHYHRHAARFLGPYRPIRMDGADAFLRRFGVRTEHSGESVENLLKIHHLVREHPDLRLFVQASPAFCCPSLVTEAMARDIQRATGVPVVSLTYDGTGRYRNDAIVPYLRYARTLDGAPAAG